MTRAGGIVDCAKGIVDCAEAIDWLRENGWARCALRMRKVAATALADAEGEVASR